MNYREMSRLAGDPEAIRGKAKLILELLGDRATPWQARLLNRLSKYEGPDLLSMEDREALYGLEGKASRRQEKGGYRASVLVAKLWALRADLPEDDEEFLASLQMQGDTCAPTQRQWAKLFVLARQTGEVDHFVG